MDYPKFIVSNQKEVSISIYSVLFLKEELATDKQHSQRAVNIFTGKIDQPIKLELLDTGATVDVDSLTVIG